MTCDAYVNDKLVCNQTQIVVGVSDEYLFPRHPGLHASPLSTTTVLRVCLDSDQTDVVCVSIVNCRQEYSGGYSVLS